MNVVSLVYAIYEIGIAKGRLAVAGTSLVDVVLDDTGVDHGQSGNPETSDDTVDRRETDLVFAEGGHKDLVNQR